MDVIGFELDLIVLQRFEFVAYFRSYTALGLSVLRWTLSFCRVWGTNLPLFTKVVFAFFDRGSYVFLLAGWFSAFASPSLGPEKHLIGLRTGLCCEISLKDFTSVGRPLTLFLLGTKESDSLLLVASCC